MFKIIAVDDEALALKRFEHLMGSVPQVELLQTFTNPLDALDYIKENTVDIAFLDIEMPELTGLELAERIQEADPFISVVFITAFDQYALEAFKAHAIGYLLKPLDISEFAALIDTISKSKAPRENNKKEEPAETAKEILKVNCLGQFTCFPANTPDSPVLFRTAKTAELFALLIHHYKAPVTKYYILDTLFPDMDYEKSNKLFYVSCSYLRSAFSKVNIVDLLIRENDSYRLNTAVISCDYFEFIEYIERINELSTEDLRKAVALYNGEYLMGRSYEWAFETKPYIDNCYQRLTFLFVEKLRNEGNKDEAYQILEKYLSLDPLREDTVSLLMTLYVEDGKKDTAVAIYRNYEKKLAEELDIFPSAKLRAIIR